MKNILYSLGLVLLASCQTLAGALGGGVGAGVGSALGGPPAAALGAVGGVIGMEAMVGGGSPKDAALAAATGQPQGQIASTMHETGGLIQTIGWWYLILFVLLPLFTKKGRTWIKKFSSIHQTVSQAEIDARDEEQDVRLNSLEQKFNDAVFKKDVE